MTLKYKGYIGSAEVDVEEGILFGKLLHIRDLINYEGETPAELKAAFEAAVDEYLDDCTAQGVDADVPFKGQFNVRVSPSLHRELAICAKAGGKSMNDYVERVLARHESLYSEPVLVSGRQQQFIVQLVAGPSTTAYGVRHRNPQQNQSHRPIPWFEQQGASDLVN